MIRRNLDMIAGVIGLMLIGFLLVVVAARAQTAPAEYNLKVKPSDLELIGNGLGKLPFEAVAPLIQSLRSQVIEQSTPTPQQPSPVPSITGEQPKK